MKHLRPIDAPFQSLVGSKRCNGLRYAARVPVPASALEERRDARGYALAGFLSFARLNRPRRPDGRAQKARAGRDTAESVPFPPTNPMRSVPGRQAANRSGLIHLTKAILAASGLHPPASRMPLSASRLPLSASRLPPVCVRLLSRCLPLASGLPPGCPRPSACIVGTPFWSEILLLNRSKTSIHITPRFGCPWRRPP